MITTFAESRSLIAKANGSLRAAAEEGEPEVERAVGRLEREAEMLAERGGERLPARAEKSARVGEDRVRVPNEREDRRAERHRGARDRVRVHHAHGLQPLRVGDGPPDSQARRSEALARGAHDAPRRS